MTTRPKRTKASRSRLWEPVSVSLPAGMKQSLASIAARRYAGTQFRSLSGLIAGLLRCEKSHKRGLLEKQAAVLR